MTEFLGFHMDVKSLDTSGVFEGFASTFGNRDFGGDIVERGAFSKSLKAKGPTGIKMLTDHDPRNRIGVWDVIEEQADGLFVKGRILQEKQIGRDAFIDVKNGLLDSMSIGFSTKQFTMDGRRRARILKEVDLFEISLVTFPMNEQAKVTGFKSAGDMTIREMEEALERGTLPPFSSREAKILLSGGFKAFSVRDAGDEEVLAALRRLGETIKS